MNKSAALILAMVVLIGFTLPAGAAYQFGSAANDTIIVGGNGGGQDTADLAGDVVASYTSTAGNDTIFKTNSGTNPTAQVRPVFGDTAAVVGASSQSMAPSDTRTFTVRIVNWANQTDVIKIESDTEDVSGLSEDSITIRVNGALIYQNGNDSFPQFALPALPPGADTTVTVEVVSSATALGQAVVNLLTIPNSGIGGDTGGYLGNNGETYAGDGDAKVTLTVNINSINVQIKVEQEVTSAPTSYNGPMGDTVPGATLTYVIRYDNDGNDTAVGFTLNTKLPANTTLGTGLDSPTASALLSPHTGATVTVTIMNDTGTVVTVTDPSASRLRWTYNIGVAPNNGDSGSSVDATTSDVDAGFVKFKVYIK